MKSGPSDQPLKHFIIAFLLALAGYALFYAAIEHRRTRLGPWDVTFISAAGAPAIVINQPSLHITNVQIRFAGQAAAGPDTQLRFDQPQQVPYDVPFGKCIFMDTTFLPGTVTFQLYGHEIELLPRVLIVDHQDLTWRSDANLALQPEAETNAQTSPNPKR
jgi:hypothetical protein